MSDLPEVERTPSAILEQHGRDSLDRIDKIDQWVQRVAKTTLALCATTLLLVVLMGVAFTYLLREIDHSRYTIAVDGCVNSRKLQHDGLEELMVSLAKTENQKLKAARLADRYFPYDQATCEAYVKNLGLKP
jgi:hypothetical protein